MMTAFKFLDVVFLEGLSGIVWVVCISYSDTSGTEFTVVLIIDRGKAPEMFQRNTKNW